MGTFQFNPFTGNLDLVGGTTTVSGITNYARSATLVVAASNSKDTTHADYVCTGTNDHTTINTAIAALPANGGSICLMDGTFNIAGTISITANNTTIYGQGAGNTVINTPAGSEAVQPFLIGDNATTCAHTRMSDFLITSANQRTSNSAIKLQKCFKTWIERIRIENAYRALYVYNSTETWFTDSDVRNTKENGITYEATLGNGYDLYLTGITMDNPDITNAGTGISWLGGENFVVQNCDAINFVTGLDIAPAASHQCRFGFFTNAEFDTSSDNTMRISSAGGDIVGLTFTQCWTGTATDYGVLIDGGSGGTTQGIRFIGHKSFHNGLAGFRIAGGKDIYLEGCDVIGNSQTVSGTRSGIEVSSGIGDHWSIVGCKSGNGYGQGTTQSYGINLDGSHAYTNFVISNNELSDNINGGLNLNGATGNPGKIFNNTGYDVEKMWTASTAEINLTNVGSSQNSRIFNDGNTHVDGGGNNVWVDGGNLYLNAGNTNNVGVGTSSPTSILHTNGAIATPITSKSSNYSLTAADSIVLASGNTTITLPDATGCTGRQYIIKKTDSSNTTTIGTTSSQTIDGSTTATITVQNTALTVASDGANWRII